VCGARRPCKRRERRLTGRDLAVGVRKDLGGLRCLTLRYSKGISKDIPLGIVCCSLCGLTHPASIEVESRVES